MGTRYAILDTALRLFSTYGYENTGVQRIVEESGVTKPVLYHYFKSKEGLLEEIFRTNLSVFLEDITKAAKYNYDVRSTLERVVETYFSYARSNTEFYKFFLLSAYAAKESELGKCVLPFQQALFGIIHNIFQRAELDHGNMKGRSFRYTVSFIGTVNSYISVSFSGNAQLDQECVREAVREYLYGIFS